MIRINPNIYPPGLLIEGDNISVQFPLAKGEDEKFVEWWPKSAEANDRIELQLITGKRLTITKGVASYNVHVELDDESVHVTLYDII